MPEDKEKAKTLETLQQEYDAYKTQTTKELGDKDAKITELTNKAHDLEVKISALNEARLHQNISDAENKSLLEDYE